jgi:DNA-binding HxlR family transcriptional regulator
MVDPAKRLPTLPAERMLKSISGLRKAIILYHLFDGPKRLSQLDRQLSGISQKVLPQQLREMEGHGLIHREVFPQVPPRAEYSATELGLSLEPVLLEYSIPTSSVTDTFRFRLISMSEDVDYSQRPRQVSRVTVALSRTRGTPVSQYAQSVEA